MANVYAIVNNGNWSNPATWFGSISPTSADDVFSNGLTVNVDVTTTVLSLRNTSATGIVAGGSFRLLPGSDLTCTAIQGIHLGSTTPVVQFAGSALTSATFRANLSAGGVPNISGYTAILHSGTGTLNIIGDITFVGIGNFLNNRFYVTSNSTGTVKVVGNVSSSAVAGSNEGTQTCIVMSGGFLDITGNVSSSAPGIAKGFVINGGAAAVKITGQVIMTGQSNMTGGSSVEVIGSLTNSGIGTAINVAGSPVIIRGEIIVNSSGAGVTGTSTVFVEGGITTNSSGLGVSTTTSTVTVGGNIIVNSSGAGVSTTTGIINVTGNVVTNGTGRGATSSSNAAITVGGDVTASTSGIAVSTGGLVSVSGSIYNTDQVQAVFAPRIRIATTTNVIRYQTFAGATQLMFSGTPITLGLPTPNNVRLGTLYGNVPQLTGTCVIPNPNSVLVGVPIDNTVGTLVMSPAAVIEELNTSTLDIAVRLQNVSTVQTMGEQAATYGI
jgi:hypothetical protein